MRTMLRFFAATLLSICAVAAAAESDFAAYSAASRDFERLVAEAAAKGDLPRHSNPQVAVVLDALTDNGLLQSRTYTVADLGNILDVCGKANAANMTYTLSGMKQLKLQTDQAQNAQLIRELAERNIVAYQDEIFPLNTFLVRCMAVQLPLLVSFFEALPPSEKTDMRKQGLLKTRESVFNLYIGALSSVAQARFAEQHRANLLAALAETATTYAAALPLERRRTLLQWINSTEQQFPGQFRPQLRSIASAMGNLSCAIMCAM